MAATDLSAFDTTFERMESRLSVAGLFAGIGGLERGLGAAGLQAELLCEWWDPAQRVLTEHWPDIPLVSDVRDLTSLPVVDVVTAGFPCTDLSQAGRTAGITGAASGLVGEVFRLLDDADPSWLVMENVRNMLVLDGGRAMRFLVDALEARGMRWTYRLVDSRFTGVPQRRQRVILVASRREDPRGVLLSDQAEHFDEEMDEELHGFYWTEGLKGIGWAVDAVPTLKGGSTVGIASPPAIWVRGAELGRRLVTPGIEDAEALQGFPRGWTAAAQVAGRRNGPRWKLVGNAVTVGVAEWLGRRLVTPGAPPTEATRVPAGTRWPTSAWGDSGEVWTAGTSLWPEDRPYRHLRNVVDVRTANPLSHRAVRGLGNRMARSSLRFEPGFRQAVADHLVHSDLPAESQLWDARVAVG